MAVEPKPWPPLLDTDDLPKRKLQHVYHAESADQLCYIDFSVSTTGMLTGAKVRFTLTPLSIVSVTGLRSDPHFWYQSDVSVVTNCQRVFDTS